MRFFFSLLFVTLSLCLFAQQPVEIRKATINKNVITPANRDLRVQPTAKVMTAEQLKVQLASKVKTASVRLPFAKRHQTIRYELDGNGHAIFQGDIDLGPEQTMLSRHANGRTNFWYNGQDRPADTPGGLTAVTDVSLLWPAGRIPYVIDDEFSATEIGVINAALANLSASTTLNIVPRLSGDKDYVTFRVMDEDAGGDGSSPVGRQGGNQDLNVKASILTNIRAATYLVQHEMLHAAGIWHEQSRPDRDRYVTIQEENIKWFHGHNFDKHEDDGRAMTEEYDYCSIMHYSANSFSSNDKPTIVRKDPAAPRGSGCDRAGGLGGSQLSDLDILGLERLYWQDNANQFGQEIPNRASVNDLVTADLDNDGYDEILIATNGDSGYRLFIYDDAGSDYALLWKGGEGWGRGAVATSIDVGNWRGVGDKDVVVTRSGNNIDRVLIYAYGEINTVSHAYPKTGKGWGNPIAATDAKFTDLDGDGTDELVVTRNATHANGDRLIVYDRGNLGNIEQVASINGWGKGIRAGALAVGDMNNDGKPEIAVARTGNFSNRPKWEVYNYRPQFDNKLVQVMSGGNTWSADVVATDLAIGNLTGTGGNQLWITRSVTSGDYPRLVGYNYADTRGSKPITPGKRDYAKGIQASCLAIADIDQDGKDEMVIGRNESAAYNLRVYDDRSQGYDETARYGKYLEAARAGKGRWYQGDMSVTSSSYPTVVTLGDVDGDGQPEVVAGLSISISGIPRIIVRETTSTRSR